MARPTKNPDGERLTEQIHWKCSPTTKNKVNALAKFFNRNVPEFLTALIFEVDEKYRPAMDEVAQLEAEEAAAKERFEQAHAAIREKFNASTGNILFPTTSELTDNTRETSSGSSNSPEGDTRNDSGGDGGDGGESSESPEGKSSNDSSGSEFGGANGDSLSSNDTEAEGKKKP